MTTTVKLRNTTLTITKAMIAAVRATEKFYAGEGLNRDCICSAAMEAKAFDRFWDEVGAIMSDDEEKLIRALKRVAWKK